MTTDKSVEQLFALRTLGEAYLAFHVAGVGGAERRILSPRHHAVLAILAFQDPVPTPREHLQEILWDGPADDRKRRSLNQALYEIRKVGPKIVDTNGNRVSLGKQIQTDIRRFRSSLDRGILDEAVDLYRGRFLDRFPYISDAFDDWRISAAATLEQLALSNIKIAISELLLKDEHEQAAKLAYSAIIIDPQDPLLLQLRVECLVRAGETSRALLEIEAARRRMAEDGTVVTSEFVSQLYERIARWSRPAEAERASGTTRLVGREREVMQLRSNWNESKSKSRVSVITGDAGIGKSRLLDQIGRVAAIEGARTFFVRCVETEAGLPYGAIVSLIRDGWRQADVDLLEEHWLSVLGTLLPELRQGQLRETPKQQIWESVQRYFSAVGRKEGRLFLGIDDYHWIDDPSRDLLTFVLRRLDTESLCTVVSGRGDIQPPVLEDEGSKCIWVRVGELEPKACDQLITSYAEANQLAINESQIEAIRIRAGGRPFFLLQTLNSALHGEASAVDWSLPPDVLSYLTRKLARLALPSRQVAAAAAVMDRPVSLHMLGSITGLSASQIAAAAGELRLEGIFLDGAEVTFSHHLIKEAVRNTTSQSERVLWHGQITRIIAQNAGSMSGELAYHAEEAGDRTLASAAASRSASEAARLHAYAMADAQFQRWVRCADGAAKLSARSSYAKFLAMLGRYDDVAPYADALESHYRQTSDNDGLILCALARFSAQEKSGTLSQDLLLEIARECVARAEQLRPDRLGSVLWRVIECLRRSGEVNTWGDFSRQLLHRSESSSPDVVHDLLTASAILAVFAHGYNEGLPVANQAVRAAKENADPVGLCRAVLVRATTTLLAGDLVSSRIDFEQALSLCTDFTPREIILSLRANLAVLLMETGETAAAVNYAQAVVEDSDLSRRAYSYGNLALIHLRENDAAGVDKYCNALLEVHRTAPHYWIPANVEAFRGLVALGKEDHANASALAARSRSAENDFVGADFAIPQVFAARMKRIEGDAAGAVHLLTRANDHIKDKDELTSRRLILELADALIDDGQPERARAELISLHDRARDTGANAVMREAAERLLRS